MNGTASKSKIIDNPGCQPEATLPPRQLGFFRCAPRIAHAMAFAALLIFIGASSTGAAPLNSVVESLLKEYSQKAKSENQAFSNFSADAGKTLFFQERRHSKKNEMRGCTTCHTKDVRQSGKSTTGQPIDPLSPAVNSKAFTDVKNIEKWFSRNCPWVLERNCSAEEKGNFITYLFSLGG